MKHPTPTDAMKQAIEGIREVYKAHGIQETQADHALWALEQAALAHQQPSGEVVGWAYEHKSHKGWESYLTTSKPTSIPVDQLRNIRPLTYAGTTAWNANMDEGDWRGKVLEAVFGLKLSDDEVSEIAYNVNRKYNHNPLDPRFVRHFFEQMMFHGGIVSKLAKALPQPTKEQG